MKSSAAQLFAPRAVVSLLVLTTLVVMASAVHAQQVYRIVGPDGKVTFSDQPPPSASNAKVSTPGTGGAGGASASAGLPFELRQVATRYPVTLYTGDNCAPCASARTMLTNRGVPFTEKTVKTNEDIQALQRLSSTSSLPFATIGGQQLKGFSDAEWTQFLNAAGYPATSTLPANYRPQPATPLVAVTAPAAPAAPALIRQAAPAAAPSAPPADNPAGIKF